jgi:hypothetical protein
MVMLPSKAESVEYLSVVSKEENDTSSIKNRRTNETIVSLRTESNKSENVNSDLNEKFQNKSGVKKGKLKSSQNKDLVSSDIKESNQIEFRAEKEPQMKMENSPIINEVERVDLNLEKEAEMKKENIRNITSEANEKTVNYRASNVKSILKNKKEQKISPASNVDNESDKKEESGYDQNVAETNPVSVKQADNSNNLQKEIGKKVNVSLSQSSHQNENTLLTGKKPSSEIHLSKNVKPVKPIKNNNLQREEKEVKAHIEQTVPAVAVNFTETERNTKDLIESKTSQADGIERLNDNPNRRRNDSNYSKKNHAQNENKYSDEYQSRKSPQRKNKYKTGDLYESSSSSVIKPHITGNNKDNNSTVVIEHIESSDKNLPLENKKNGTQETPTPNNLYVFSHVILGFVEKFSKKKEVQ